MYDAPRLELSASRLMYVAFRSAERRLRPSVHVPRFETREHKVKIEFIVICIAI